MFDFKNCNEFSFNIKFPSADQNILKRIILWLLHFSLVLLKVFAPRGSFAVLFDFCVFSGFEVLPVRFDFLRFKQF